MLDQLAGMLEQVRQQPEFSRSEVHLHIPHIHMVFIQVRSEVRPASARPAWPLPRLRTLIFSGTLMTSCSSISHRSHVRPMSCSPLLMPSACMMHRVLACSTSWSRAASTNENTFCVI